MSVPQLKMYPERTTSQEFLNWLYANTSYLPEPFHGHWSRQRGPMRDGCGVKLRREDPGDFILRSGDGNIFFQTVQVGPQRIQVSVNWNGDEARNLLAFLLAEIEEAWPETKRTIDRYFMGTEGTLGASVRAESQPENEVPRSTEQRITPSVFFAYSHCDEDLRDELEKHLSLLKRQGLISSWHDRRIGAGKEWEGEISSHLNSADIILLLISSDFLHSDYCYDVEMKRAMERHERKEAVVIPIILRAVIWRDAPFGKLQALPKDAKPVRSWDDVDEALADVAAGIRAAIDHLAQGPDSLPVLEGTAGQRTNNVPKAEAPPSATTGVPGTPINITAGRGGDALAPGSTGGKGGDINFRGADGTPADNSEMLRGEPTVIKDTEVKLDAERVDKAAGMNIDNVPAELWNVRIDVKAKDVKDATGLNVTARNINFAVSSKVIMCSCGNVIRCVATCGYEPLIKCPKCGKEYKNLVP